MPKVELSNVSSGYNLAAINSNFEKIETALNDSVLFRDDVGINPNSMSVDLDMNNQRIFNLPAPVLNNEPLRKGDIGDLEGSIASIEANKIAAEYAAEVATGAVSSINTSVSDAAAYAAAAESSSRLTVGTVITGSPGSSASVSITGTPGTQSISFTIPRGDVGPQGPQGEQGLPGTGSGDVTLNGVQTLTNKTLTSPVITSGTVDTFPIGYRNIPQVSQSAAYTTVLTDAGKHILHPSADTTARTFTIPANASVAYPIGTAITFVNQNAAGIVTIAITSDVMRLAGAGTTGSRTLAANGVATAIKITSTEWIINGTGLT